MRRRLAVGGRWLLAAVGAALLAGAPAPTAAAPPEANTPQPSLFDTLFGADAAAERAGKASDGLALPDLFIDGQRVAEALPLHDLGPAGDKCVAAIALLDGLSLAHRSAADGSISVDLPEPRRTVTIPAGALQASPAGPCLPLKSASAWLPISLAHDAESQRLRLATNAPLPVMMRLARAERQARLRPATERADFALVARPRGLARLWTADLALTLTSGSEGRDVAGTIAAAGELLGLGARVSLGLSGRGPVTVGVTLADASDTASLLGPFEARSVAIGDVTSPAQPLIADTLFGRGLTISSRPPWRADLVDEITLSGALPPGWEAELWHEDRLVAFTRTATPAGQWQFAGLPVRLGENRWVVKLFGPHGEQDEQVFTRLVGSAMNAENEIDYTIGVIDGGAPLIGTAPNRAASGSAAFASLGWGVAPSLTARLDLRAPPGGDPALAIGLHGAFGRLLWAATGARDSLGGSGFALRLASRLGAQDLVLDLARHGQDAGPQQAPQVRQFASLAGLNVQGRLPMGRLSLPWQMRLETATLRTGGQQQKVAGRLALPLARWQANVALGLTRQSRAAWQGNAALGLSANLGALRLRGGVDASLGQRWRLAAVTLSSAYAIRNGAVSLDLGWQPAGRAASFGLSVNHRLGPFGLSANVGGGKDGWRTGLSLVMGVWNGAGRWHAAPAGLARGGAVLADLFIDENDNGARDPGDAGVKGGRFIAGAALRTESTAADGRVLLRGLPAGPAVDVETQLAALDDFTLRPARAGDRLALRPGEVRQLAVPLRRTGSIEVQVLLAAGDARTPRSGVPVTLRDSRGNAAARGVTDFEGYVLFDGLSLGRFFVEAAGQSSPALALSRAAPDQQTTVLMPSAAM
jgi:hypothetical protein